MASMNVSDIYVFNQVASNLSFAKAATIIGISRSTISKKINRLEEDLGVPLFYRNTRSVSLTDAGRVLLRHARDIDLIVSKATEDLRRPDNDVLHTVTLSLPTSLARLLAKPLNTAFQKPRPNVRLKLHFDDEFVDLIADGFDLAIRISSKLKDSSLISRRLTSTRKILVASRQYLERWGSPKSPDDLKNHRCIGFGNIRSSENEWTINRSGDAVPTTIAAPVVANNAQALILAARFGGGIIYIPEICVTEEVKSGLLEVLVMDDHLPESCGVFAVYPQRNTSPTVQTLIDFIQEQLGCG